MVAHLKGASIQQDSGNQDDGGGGLGIKERSIKELHVKCSSSKYAL